MPAPLRPERSFGVKSSVQQKKKDSFRTRLHICAAETGLRHDSCCCCAPSNLTLKHHSVVGSRSLFGQMLQLERKKETRKRKKQGRKKNKGMEDRKRRAERGERREERGERRE